MEWMCIKMPASEVPGGLYAAMFSLFESALKMAGGPTDFAVMEYSPNPDEHVFYFSRQAVLFGGQFLAENGAVICDAPPLTEETILLIGASDARHRLLSAANSPGK